jgi:hypothetical protein
MSCPKCIAEQGLRALRDLNEGRDASVIGASFVLRGKPLDHSTLAGIGEALLEQVVNAVGPACPRHGGPRRARKEASR